MSSQAILNDTHSALGFRVLRSLRRIIRQVSAHSRSLSSVSGVTVPQMLCMRAIADAGAKDSSAEVTSRAVAQAVQLSPSTVSGVMERLVQAGLVLRERSTKDRRRVHLSLTPAGKDTLSAAPNPLQERFLSRLQGLPKSEQEQLLEALERVVQLMDADEIEAAPILTPGPMRAPKD
ncbi:MAG: DNA-binding MarR family transcriptional regulator [Cognaticolwellia sp.]|jgi:DNA-binding MarR family transcriptional regulator